MRSLTLRLALLFGAVAAGAIAVVLLGVVPSLRSRLVEQKLSTLAAVAGRHSPPVRQALASSADVRVIDRRVRQAADDSGSRVTLLAMHRRGGILQAELRSDSTAEIEIRGLRFALAVEAASAREPRRGTETGANGSVGQAAVPLWIRPLRARRPIVAYVLVFSEPLEDVQAGVAPIRRRILAAGAIALALAVIAGWLVARSVTTRIGRMQQAARRVAQGDFSARFEAGSRDELGRLAETLDQMQRQLAELDTARRRFIATASHELRTPIFSLGGFVELLQDEELEEHVRRAFLDQIRAQVDRLGKLATNLLDLSRLEAGALRLRPEPTDLADLARTVAAEFTPALGAHESRLELRAADGPVKGLVDADRVGQILRILIDNALSHTPAGTDVVVAAGRSDGRVRLSVTDYGAGIARSDMPRIFEPFYTADDAPGSGLGLAIAHELAERMRGELTARSEPGRTTFALELPA